MKRSLNPRFILNFPFSVLRLSLPFARFQARRKSQHGPANLRSHDGRLTGPFTY
jgi:hypothetical protein